jgi:hypothetical protein
MAGEQETSKATAWLQRAKDALTGRLLEWSHRNDTDIPARYNVTLTGRFTLPEQQAVENLAAFLKQGTENTRRLLQAGRIFKTYQEKTPADKLARVLQRAGVECRVELETDEPEDTPNALQKAAYALDAAAVPLIRLPDVRMFGWRQWLLVGVVASCLLVVSAWVWLRAPVVEGNTVAEYEASIENVLSKTAPEQQLALRHSIDVLMEPASATAEDERATLDQKTGNDRKQATRKLYAPIAGKNAKQLLALAETKLEKKRAAYREGLAQAESKIAELDKQLAAQAPDNAVALDKIVISEASFGWSAGSPTPSMVFFITNGSSEKLTRIFLHGYLHDPQGTLLVTAPVTYAIAGGLLPGTKAGVGLPTMIDSPWTSNAVRNRRDLVFTLRVANAENVQGKPLGKDYRPLENDKLRQQEWKKKMQAQLDAMAL